MKPKTICIFVRGGVSMLALTIACVFLGCNLLSSDTDEEAMPATPSGVLLDGYIDPMNATKLYAPENVFKIAGWSSTGNHIKLTQLTRDGAQVKAGDVIAQFEFSGDRALPWIEESKQQVYAASQQFEVEAAARLEELKTEKTRQEIKAKRAAIDLQKERAISRRQAELYKLDHNRAQFEAEAADKQLGAYKKYVATERAYHKMEMASADFRFELFDAFKERFSVRAPHDGFIRHAFLPRERRKVQKGDGMHCGDHFVSVAKDDRISVRFFVPEHRLHQIAVGDEVKVKSLSSEHTYSATVTLIEPFPQELGFVKQDPGLSNAREKIYVTYAEFAEQPDDLSAGVGVKVGLK